MREKKCAGCGETKPISEYYTRPSRAVLSAPKVCYQSRCKSCQLLNFKQKRANGDYKERDRIQYSNNRDREIQRSKDYAKRNRVKVNAAKRAYEKANPEKKKRWAKKEYEKNKGRIFSQVKEWRKSNPDKVRAYHQSNQEKRLRASGELAKEEFDSICEKYGNKCLCCGQEKKLSADHIIPATLPWSRNSADNRQPLCDSCNKRKHAKTIDFRPEFSSVILGNLSPSIKEKLNT